MNVLVQAALGALLAVGGVTAAVTTARPDTIKLWVPSVVVTGHGHDGSPVYALKQAQPTKELCEVWLNSPAGRQSLAGFVLREAVEHQDDDTFDVSDPVCVQREMDPPGTPT